METKLLKKQGFSIDTYVPLYMHKKRNGVIPFFGKIIALTVMAFSVKNVTVKSVKIRQLLKFLL